MTIHARVTRNPSEQLDGIHISVTAESIQNFIRLVDRALNCWDNAPKELKELGDMLTHSRITQDHSYQPMSTKDTSRDYYTAEEQEIIRQYIEANGNKAWLEHLRAGTANQVLKR